MNTEKTLRLTESNALNKMVAFVTKYLVGRDNVRKLLEDQYDYIKQYPGAKSLRDDDFFPDDPTHKSNIIAHQVDPIYNFLCGELRKGQAWKMKNAHFRSTTPITDKHFDEVVEAIQSSVIEQYGLTIARIVNITQRLEQFRPYVVKKEQISQLERADLIDAFTEDMTSPKTRKESMAELNRAISNKSADDEHDQMHKLSISSLRGFTHQEPKSFGAESFYSEASLSNMSTASNDVFYEASSAANQLDLGVRNYVKRSRSSDRRSEEKSRKTDSRSRSL